MNNKKGYYRFADIGMFIISFAIIAIGISIGIYVFYSHQVDIRGQEARILSDKLVRVIVSNGKLNQDVLLEDFNIFQEAKIDSRIIKNGDFYFRVEIFEGENLVKSFKEGNRDFEVECGLRSDKFPKCNPEDFVLDNYRVEILTASNQLGGRI